MHPENHYYGHAGALADAAYGPEAPPIIRGQVQHGWSFGHGLGAKARQVAGLPRLGWGERTRAQAEEDGVRNLTLIGAPFVYLARARGIGPATPKPSGTVVYPFHGTEKWEVIAAHDRLADEIAEREVGRVTVVLYFSDHTPQAVRAYEQRGFTVVCHGHRRDPEFMGRQLEVLAGHDRVVSNRVGSALWYGAHLGLEAEIYGPCFGDAQMAAIDDRLDLLQRELWPELHAGAVAGPAAVELGDAELGADHARSGEELRALLGPPIDTVRRRLRRRAARVEYQTRRVLVRGLGTCPPFASIDAVPMPRNLPTVERAPALVP